MNLDQVLVWRVGAETAPFHPARDGNLRLTPSLRQFFRPMGVGEKSADNLPTGPDGDVSRRDPLPSSLVATGVP